MDSYYFPDTYLGTNSCNPFNNTVVSGTVIIPFFFFFSTSGKTKIQRIYKYGYTKNLYNLHLNSKSFDLHFNYHSICWDRGVGSENEQKQINAETPSCYFMVHSCSLSRKQYWSALWLWTGLCFLSLYTSSVKWG